MSQSNSRQTEAMASPASVANSASPMTVNDPTLTLSILISTFALFAASRATCSAAITASARALTGCQRS